MENYGLTSFRALPFIPRDFAVRSIHVVRRTAQDLSSRFSSGFSYQFEIDESATRWLSKQIFCMHLIKTLFDTRQLYNIDISARSLTFYAEIQLRCLQSKRFLLCIWFFYRKLFTMKNSYFLARISNILLIKMSVLHKFDGSFFYRTHFYCNFSLFAWNYVNVCGKNFSQLGLPSVLHRNVVRSF